MLQMNMNNHKFIDALSYEIISDELIIEVDPDIAEAISLLNQKGYKTKACCSGHALDLNYYKQICDISLLDEEEIKKDYPEYYIVDKTDRTFTLVVPKIATSIYIMFEQDYHFDSLPDGFAKEPSFDDSLMNWSKIEFNTVRKRIDYYENNVKRNPNDVQQEILKYNNLLLEWVRKLPKINERNDE